MYPHTQLLIAGEWVNGEGGDSIDVVNPATGEVVGTVAKASTSDLDRALETANSAFRAWRKVPAVERSRLLRRAAEIVRERAGDIARIVTHRLGIPRDHHNLDPAPLEEVFRKGEHEAAYSGFEGTTDVHGRQVGLAEWLRERGIGVIHGGANSLRFTPHFAIGDDELDLLVSMVGRALREGPRRSEARAA